MNPVIFTLVLLLTLLLQGNSLAGDADVLSQEDIKITYEKYKLPGNEKMGMLGLGIDHQLNSHVRVGVASYAAVRGERGGFITLGASVSANYPLTRGLELDSGLFLGAGGGHGGYALSGGGLMLRAHAGANYDVGTYGKLGLGVSAVDFPNGGTINSVQPYITYTLPFYAFTEPGWREKGTRHLSRDDEMRLSPLLHEFALYFRSAMVSSGVRTTSGLSQTDFNLLGVEWRTYLNDYLFTKLETEGAAGGESAGYMHILAGAGVRYPLSRNLFATASIAAGGGGGGGVDTGGGLLADAALGLQYYVAPRLYIDVSGNHLRAPSGGFEANGVGVKLGYKFGSTAKDGPVLNGPYAFDPNFLRVRLTNQTYIKAPDSRIANSVDRSVDNLGVQFDYFINPGWFVTGQGLAAYGGNAGAYMAGFVGVGYRRPLAEKIFAEIEALIGVAGGGGLATGGGLSAQANVGLGYSFSETTALMITLGEIDSVNGSFRAPVAGVSLAFMGRAYSRKQ